MQEERGQARRRRRTDRADARPRQRSGDRAVRRQTSRSVDRRSCSSFLPNQLRHESDPTADLEWPASNIRCTPQLVRGEPDLLVCGQAVDGQDVIRLASTGPSTKAGELPLWYTRARARHTSSLLPRAKRRRCRCTGPSKSQKPDGGDFLTASRRPFSAESKSSLTRL